MNQYMYPMVGYMGVPMAVFALLMVWSMAWKLVALWKSARKGDLVWFIVMALLNTVGILPILYIFVFSNVKKSSTKPVKRKITKKKPKKKKK